MVKATAAARFGERRFMVRLLAFNPASFQLRGTGRHAGPNCCKLDCSHAAGFFAGSPLSARHKCPGNPDQFIASGRDDAWLLPARSKWQKRRDAKKTVPEQC